MFETLRKTWFPGRQSRIRFSVSINVILGEQRVSSSGRSVTTNLVSFHRLIKTTRRCSGFLPFLAIGRNYSCYITSTLETLMFRSSCCRVDILASFCAITSRMTFTKLSRIPMAQIFFFSLVKTIGDTLHLREDFDVLRVRCVEEQITRKHYETRHHCADNIILNGVTIIEYDFYPEFITRKSRSSRG